MPEIVATGQEKKPAFDMERAYKLRFKNRMSYQEIADYFSMPNSTIKKKFSRLRELLIDPDEIKAYDEVEAELMTAARMKILTEMVTDDKLKKAGVNNLAYAHDKLFINTRLKRDESTSNVAQKLVFMVVGHDQEHQGTEG